MLLISKERSSFNNPNGETNPLSEYAELGISQAFK